MDVFLYLIAGAFAGGAVTWLIAHGRAQREQSGLEIRAGSAEALSQERFRLIGQREQELTALRGELARERGEKTEAHTRLKALEQQLREERERIESLKKEMEETFKVLSLDALTRNTEEFKKYADEFIRLAEEKLRSRTQEGKQELEGKKELIDRNIEIIGKTLSDVQRRIEDVGRTSGEKFTEVATLIKRHEEITSRLKETTEHLGQALASSKKRGEWGERMAEDVLRLAGMTEGINYVKQKTLEASSGRPDFTFFLPRDLTINMDVKFPLDNYLKYVNTEGGQEKKRFRDELVRNAKLMIRQVTTREYIDPSRNTVDYVLVFIPNEQVYSFINEADPSIMDEALRSKVILCSPFTLYAMLAVIRQAVENFNLERTASEILGLLMEFSRQWNTYKERFKVMGDRLDAARKEYDTLLSTRSGMLERPLRKIDELGRKHAISTGTASGDE